MSFTVKNVRTEMTKVATGKSIFHIKLVTSKWKMFIQTCVKCKHFRFIEDRVGRCVLFGNLAIARINENLCGKSAKFFEPCAPKPPLEKFRAPDVDFGKF